MIQNHHVYLRLKCHSWMIQQPKLACGVTFTFPLLADTHGFILLHRTTTCFVRQWKPTQWKSFWKWREEDTSPPALCPDGGASSTLSVCPLTFNAIMKECQISRIQLIKKTHSHICTVTLKRLNLLYFYFLSYRAVLLLAARSQWVSN